MIDERLIVGADCSGSRSNCLHHLFNQICEWYWTSNDVHLGIDKSNESKRKGKMGSGPRMSEVPHKIADDDHDMLRPIAGVVDN